MLRKRQEESGLEGKTMLIVSESQLREIVKESVTEAIKKLKI